MTHPSQPWDVETRLDGEDLSCLELCRTETGSLVQFEAKAVTGSVEKAAPPISRSILPNPYSFCGISVVGKELSHLTVNDTTIRS